MREAVLLLSSGLDSAANFVLPGDFRVALALTIDYGQRGAQRELDRAGRLAGHFRVEHVRFDLQNFSRLAGGRSALLGGQAVPEIQQTEALDDYAAASESAKAVWVPNRNGVMISIAAALAESRGLNAVAVGFNAEEGVTFPDNTPAYMEAMTASLRYSTANGVGIVSATAPLTKKQIVERLAGREFPFEMLWSCYLAEERHCGRCESCQRLKRALAAGLKGSERAAAERALFEGGQ